MKILITGTRCGIGNYLARHFGAAGHEIWGISRNPQTDFQCECDAGQIAFRSQQCDVSDWRQMAAFREAVGKEWQYADALICCAGVQGPIGSAMEVDPVEWSNNGRVNLDGTFYSIRAFYDLLRLAPRRAKIICLSGGGSTSPRINFTPYASAKAGMVRLVENLALEWTGLPIDINAVAPGAINTRMTDEVLQLGPTIAGEKEYATAVKQKQSGGASLSRFAAMIEMLFSPQGDGVSGKLISTPWDPWETFAARQQELAQSDIYTLRRIVPEDRGKKW
jgi:3-oxoacyl-[acyl-carrier protein] reductase